MGAVLNRRKWAAVPLFVVLGLLAIAPVADAASCGGRKATIKPKGKSGMTKKLNGTNGDDVIVSEGGKQKIKAKAGNDIICSGKGGDKIDGGEGDDLIFGGGGGDNIDGGGGNDTIHGEHGGDNVTGNLGDDSITGEDGGDKTLDGGEGNDSVNGNDGTDTLTGGGGTDTLLGERGADALDGGPGDGDTVLSGIDNDNKVTGGAGNDDHVSAGPGDDEGVSGGDGNGDIVDGDFGNDTVDGGAGDNDVVNGGNGGDKLSGGAGAHDIASYVSAAPGAGAGNHGVLVDLTAGVSSGENEDTLSGFEDVIGSPFEDVLVGSSPASRLDGFLGMDKCSTGNANEFISCNETVPTPVCLTTCVDLDPKRLDGVPHLVVLGTIGADAPTVEFTGGAFVVSDTAAGVRALAGCTQSSGLAAPTGPATCATPPMPIDALIYGGDGNDTLTLSASAPASVGFKLNGGLGDDTVQGGPGDDVVDGGPTGMDNLFGGGGSDVLQSRFDADQMHGGDGDDLLESNSPCDGHLYDGGAGTDNASFAASFGAYDITAAIGGVAVDKTKPGCKPSQINSSNEYLEGGPGDDTLTGDGGNNSLLGRAGRDTLIGMGGNDTMNGLEGADIFLGGAGKDEIRAQDAERDKKIDCGPPSFAELALVDKQDPKTVNCGKAKKGKKKKK
jgi:Ca2+-binding RTX toxin-like protein